MRTDIVIGIALTIMYYLLLVFFNRVQKKRLIKKSNEEYVNNPSLEVATHSSTQVMVSSDFGQGINIADEKAAMVTPQIVNTINPEISQVEKAKPVRTFIPTPTVSAKSKTAFVNTETIAIPATTKNKVKTMLEDGQDIFQQKSLTVTANKEPLNTASSEDLFEGTIFESGISDSERLERRTALEKECPPLPSPTTDALLNVGLFGQDLEAIKAAAQKVRLSDEFKE